MAVDVGTAYLTIAPSAQGFASKLQTQLQPGMQAAGAKAGKEASKGFGGAFKAGMGLAAKAGILAIASVGVIGIGLARKAIAEARESEKVGKTTAQIIKSTGGAAKVSAQQVGDLANAISVKAGVDDEAIQSGANLLLTFKKVRNEAGKGGAIFDRATKAAVDLSATGFGSINSSSKMLGKALNDPVKGLTALNRAGVQFTDQQKEQIKALVKTGDVLGAQKIILKEVESQVGGVAAANATMGEKVKVAWDNFLEKVGTKALPLLDKLGTWFINDGIPALERFGRFITTKVIPPVSAFAGWIRDKLWPALQKGYQTILPGVKKALDIISGGVGDNKVNWQALGKIITDKVIPFISKMVNVYLPLWATQIRTIIEVVKALWKAFQTYLRIVTTVVDKVSGLFAGMVRVWATVLDALSHVPGFGWAKDAAEKLRNAATKADAFGDAIRSIPNQKSVDVKVRFTSSGQVRLPNGVKVDVGQYRARAMGGPVRKGQPYVVGEKRPEVFVPKEDGRIVPTVSSGGGTAGKSLTIMGNVGYDPAALFVEWDKAERLDAALHPMFGG